MTAPLPTTSSPSRGVVRAADLVAVRERMVAATLPDEDAGLVDVTVKLYDGARHEILNEINRDQITADVRAWLDAHL